MATVAQWVRLALTGDPESTTPSDSVITMLGVGSSAELASRFPECLIGDVLTGAEFVEAVGYAIAAKLVLTPGGQQWARVVLESKQGPVTKVYQASTNSQAEAAEILRGASSSALSRIACVREALAATPRASLVGLSGRRRSLGCGC